jgi:hypothetical protein
MNNAIAEIPPTAEKPTAFPVIRFSCKFSAKLEIDKIKEAAKMLIETERARPFNMILAIKKAKTKAE